MIVTLLKAAAKLTLLASLLVIVLGVGYIRGWQRGTSVRTNEMEKLAQEVCEAPGLR